MNPRLRTFRRALIALAMVGLSLVMAACQETGAAPAEGEATVAVTLAPSLGSTGLSAQGIPADLEISEVFVFVRDASTGDEFTEPDCFVFASDGTIDVNFVEPTTDECALSIWDGNAVVPRTLQLPPRDSAGSPIPYDFFLNVRSVQVGTTIEFTSAFSSEAISELSTATTVRFDDLRSILHSAFFRTYAPNDVAECPPFDTEVEAGESVSLYLFPFGFGAGGTICFGGSVGVDRPLIPFNDFGIGPGTVTLDGLDVTTSALLSESKRGLRIEVPSSAAPGQTLSVSLPVNGFGPVYASDSDQNPGVPLVDGTEPEALIAAQNLQITEPPVPTGIDPDLTPPTIETARANLSLTEALLTIGTSPEPADVADVADVLAFLGVQQIALETKTVFSDSNANGAFVNFQAYICSDFARFVPALGEPGTDLELTFFAVDPTGNQSVSYTAPITVNSSYSGPSGSCANTFPL